jgi:hypothetical protein
MLIFFFRPIFTWIIAVFRLTFRVVISRVKLKKFKFEINKGYRFLQFTNLPRIEASR